MSRRIVIAVALAVALAAGAGIGVTRVARGTTTPPGLPTTSLEAQGIHLQLVDSSTGFVSQAAAERAAAMEHGGPPMQIVTSQLVTASKVPHPGQTCVCWAVRFNPQGQGLETP